MLERATVCLDIGGRRLLRTPQKPFRSRRSLHSAFWCHGAGDIDLPSWWISLLQVPSQETSSPSTSKKKPKTSLVNLPTSGFLEFLYPTKTLALVHKFVVQDSLLTRSRSQRSTGPNTIRAYTSGTTEAHSDLGESYSEFYLPSSISTNTTHDETEANTAPRTSTGTEKDLARKELEPLQRQPTKSASDELLAVIQHLGDGGPKISRQHSIQIIDLLYKIPFWERRSIHYSYAIQANLCLKNVSQSLALHREAVSRLQGSFGTSKLLCYFVQHENWDAAVESWDTYWKARKPSAGRPDVWDDIDSMNLSLIGKALRAAYFAIGKRHVNGWDESRKYREFAVALILRAFSLRNEHIHRKRIQKLWFTLPKLTQPTPEHLDLASEQLLSLGGQDNIGAAVMLFTNTVQKYQELEPTKNLLESLMVKLQVVHSPRILEIFNLYHDRFGAPSQRAYRLIIREMSNRGNTKATYSLLEQYQKYYGNPVKPDIYQSLLYAHYRRAEVGEVVRLFTEFPSKFGFTPTLACWNIVIASHSRVSDLAGTLEWYNQLLESGLEPDALTLSIIMRMYGYRGDVEAVEDWLESCEKLKIKKSCSMIDSLVLANINTGEFEKAERLVKEALGMELTGNRTRMWNCLLNGFANRLNLVKVYQLHQSMQEAKVRVDGFTFASLMQSLCVQRHPSAADKILRIVMPKKRVQATAFHYAIVMGGYIATKQYEKALETYDQMLVKQVESSFSTKTLVIKAVTSMASSVDEDKQGGKSYLMGRAEVLLDKILEEIDLSDIAAPEPIKGIGTSRLDEASSSNYFDYLIFIYGQKRAFTKVSDLYDKYIATAKRLSPEVDVSPPLKMLCSLMVVHLRDGHHDEVERCWYLALEKTERLTCRSNADFSKPNWVLPARRRALDLPLLHYMKSLVVQHRTSDVEPVFSQLQTWGYAISNKGWNLYVQALARTDEGLLKSFEICERELMKGWQGWGNPKSPGIGVTERLRLLQPRSWDTERRIPSYKTMVHLGSAYMELQSRYAFDDSGDTPLKQLDKMAPMSVDAVKQMPRIDDQLQLELLRRW